jgi:hypothetical protein
MPIDDLPFLTDKEVGEGRDGGRARFSTAPLGWAAATAGSRSLWRQVPLRVGPVECGLSLDRMLLAERVSSGAVTLERTPEVGGRANPEERQAIQSLSNR